MKIFRSNKVSLLHMVAGMKKNVVGCIKIATDSHPLWLFMHLSVIYVEVLSGCLHAKMAKCSSGDLL